MAKRITSTSKQDGTIKDYTPQSREAIGQTWRGKTVGKCHQAVARERAAEVENIDLLFPKPTNMSLKAVRIREISRSMAWKVISRYEWLGTLPPCRYYFGAMFDGLYCGGVACVQAHTGAGPYVHKWMSVPLGKVAYLVRGACVHWAPTGTAPKLINRTAKEMGRLGFHSMLAYADTDAGEIGTVYQAAGWHCLGYGSSIIEYVSPKGRVYNGILANELRKKYGRGRWKDWDMYLVDNGWRKQKSNPKLRYAKVLEAGRNNVGLRRMIEVESIPYPKRDEPGDAVVLREQPGVQSGEGSSTLTLPLHRDPK